ncbi:hypothetical protein BDC45DRAFT_511835 [Circinella umbellata]|nr:hypothetical protein BDC45DRAFT_511835 [Circinella umbellata]
MVELYVIVIILIWHCNYKYMLKKSHLCIPGKLELFSHPFPKKVFFVALFFPVTSKYYVFLLLALITVLICIYYYVL